MSPAPDLSSSSLDSVSSQPDNLALVPEDTSSSPQLETFRPGSGPSQPQSNFVGLRVVHELEKERDMNNLRAGFLQKHRKRLYDPIDIAPPPAKRVCPERSEEDPTAEVLSSTMSHSDEAGPSATTATLPDVIGPSAMAATQPDVARPKAVAVVQPDVAAPSNVPFAVEAHGMEWGPKAAVDEEGPDQKSSPTAAVPRSWEEMMEMLKGVSCFTNAEAPSIRMFDFFPFTKRVSVNMGGDPPTFVKARLPFGTSRVCRVLHSASAGMDNPQDCRSGNPFFAAFSFFLRNSYSVAWYYLLLLLFYLGCGRHPLYDAYTRTAFQVAGSGRGYARFHLPPFGRH